MNYRALCHRCLRPQSVCYCELLPRIQTRTRVVFLQHPRERRVAVGTARMAHLSLPNSELHQGVSFDGRPALESVLSQPGTAVLFPGDGARDVSEWADELRTLVVIDGTWSLAGKVLKQSKTLQRLPRLAFTPSRPGNYRIRKEPAEHCVATIEAVAEVLGRLEGPAERFLPMLHAFERMVDWQIEHRDERVGPPRRKVHKPVRAPPLPRDVLQNPSRLVVFYAEANAYPLESDPHYAPELVHLVAERVATGERLELMAQPRSPLAPRVCEYVEVAAADLMAAPVLEDGRKRWAAFCRPDDVLAGWGHFARGLLTQDGFALPPFIDLRRVAARALRSSPGDLETSAAHFHPEPMRVWARGRAGRRIAALSGVAGALLARYVL